jgi:hypothetical protein
MSPGRSTKSTYEPPQPDGTVIQQFNGYLVVNFATDAGGSVTLNTFRAGQKDHLPEPAGEEANRI